MPTSNEPIDRNPPSRAVVTGLANEVQALRETVNTLIDNVTEVDASVKKEEDRRRRSNLIGGVLVVLAILLAGYGVHVTQQLSDLAAKNRTTNQRTSQIVKAIQDATGPSAQVRQAQSLQVTLAQLDATQRAELQQVINDVAALLGKPAPTLTAPVPKAVGQ